MNEKAVVAGMSISEWKEKFPLMGKVMNLDEAFWTNGKYESFEDAIKKIDIGLDDAKDAEDRLKRFAPYIAKVFPATREAGGIIESPTVRIPKMKSEVEAFFGTAIKGELLLKCDSQLAISGSIKARGGIYEVLKHAEELAIEAGMLSTGDDYSKLDSDEFKSLFSGYSIAVGSTGNLGLSIGIMSAQLGFKVYVHMSADAKQWKKDLLRSKGVTVVEYESDYSKAVEEGRRQSESDPNMYFVDDENSKNLFMGYAVAASRLKGQLDDMGVKVDREHPLFVYLPCGVGGGPGGVTFGLKLMFKDNVHCFFAEPTHSPCMLIGLMSGLHDKVCVQDFGIDNKTAADGLAVGRASGFVGKVLENLISGCCTVKDETMYMMLSKMIDSEGITLEPSALAGVPGAAMLFGDALGQEYIKSRGLESFMDGSSHIAWATGGSMVPEEIMDEYYATGKRLLSQPLK